MRYGYFHLEWNKHNNIHIMKRLISRLLLTPVLAISFAVNAQDDLSSWEQAYSEVLPQDEQRALSMLQDRYNALPPGIEKLYISSKIHGFMILRGQPFHGNKISYDSEYSQLEQTFIAALNSEEALEFDVSKQNYLSLLKHVTESNQIDGKILFEYHLCRSLNRQGQFHKAALYCSSLNTHLDDTKQSILPRYKALRVIANNFEYLGDYQNALKFYQEYLAIIPNYIDPSGVYNDAGLLLKNLGNMQLAKEYVGIALKLRGSNPTKLFLAQSHHSMGDILLTDGDYQSALHHFTQSKKILKQFNHIYGLTYALLGLGKTYTALGDYELGNRYLLEALENASVQGNGQLRGEIYLTLASAHQKQNNFVRAEDFANNAMNLSLAIKSAPLKGQALKTLAHLAEAQGKYQQSLTYYQRYIDTELDKRDKQHQSAYIALDTARKEYIQQLQHSKLLDTNKRQSAEIQRLTSLSQVFAFFSATLMVLLFSTSFFKRKALKQAEKDLLTGAWNRAAAIRDIKKLPKIKDDHYKYLVILLDLDDFKLINDQYGHPTGDAALSHVSELILQHCNIDDIFGRLGGEEFVIVMRNLDELDIQDKVMSLHKAIANTPFRSECNKKLNVTASFSYLATSKSLADFNELYSILDQALYQVKQKGKNSVIDAFNEPIYLEKSAYVPTPP